MPEETEFDAILRQKGILPALTAEQVEAVVDDAVREKYAPKKLEDRSLDELDELEDIEDDRVLESYRRKRLAELRAQSLRATHGGGVVVEIGRADYARETAATAPDAVILHLFQPHLPACRNLDAHLVRAARRYPASRFLRIKADRAAENYPDKNCPTLLV
ncbi:Phosducin-like protein 3, partial [Cladochytrium tenue]